MYYRNAKKKIVILYLFLQFRLYFLEFMTSFLRDVVYQSVN